MFVNFNILNQLGSPAINSNTFANRPAAGQTGRLFVSTDTFEIYRDNGTTWDLIGGPGSSTITGTGTATQVAYFTSSQAIGSSANLYWDNTNSRLGIGTSSPGVRLDVHGTGIMQHINSTSGTANALMAFQRTGTTVWRLGDVYAGGNNYFEIYNNSTGYPAFFMRGASNQTIFTAGGNYSGAFGSVGNQFTFSHVLPAGTTVAAPDVIGAVNSYLDLSVGGNVTIANGTRQGLEGNSRISFSGAGTMTVAQGSTLRAFSALSTVYSFAGSAVGTITHLAGMRICFPDNIGSAVNVTNNYAILINNQSTGSGTVTYTNRWGIYQEGASDLNYFAGNMLLGSTVNNGLQLQVTGSAYFSNTVGIGIVPAAFVGASALQVQYATVEGRSSLPSFAEYAANSYSDAGVRKYIASDFASRYTQFQGQHIWLTAPSGTAGNNITFTQAMTLTAAGNLGIGSTSPAYKLSVLGSALANMISWTDNVNNTGYLGIRSTAASIGADNNLVFETGATERMRITSAGNVLIGTTTDAGQKLQVNGTARASEFNSTSGSLNVAPATPTTFFTPGSVGLYMAHIYLPGNATQTWDAVIIFAFNATNVLIVNQTNGVNVSTSVSGTNIQVTQIGGVTFTFNYEIIKIA
jgi:hypothetical protein